MVELLIVTVSRTNVLTDTTLYSQVMHSQNNSYNRENLLLVND